MSVRFPFWLRCSGFRALQLACRLCGYYIYGCCDIGALIIRIRFGGGVYYITFYNKEPLKPYSNY